VILQNASYLANIALEGISGNVSRELLLGNFAGQMHEGIGTVLAVDTPSDGSIGSWLGVLAFLIGIGVGLKHLISKKPTHAELATKEELAQYVRQSQFNEFKTEVRGDMGEIKALIAGAVSKVEDYAEKSYLARKGIHKQVNEIDKGLTQCQTRQNEQEKQIIRIQDHG
jgi:hypothetical protein